MDAGHGTAPTLGTVFEAAKRFGLTDAEAWEILDWCVEDAGPDATVSELMDGVTATLARCILGKARRGRSSRHAPEAAPAPGRRRPA